MRNYRKHRLAEGAAATSVNKEVQFLRRVLKEHGLALPIRPLCDDPRPLRSITADEWSRLVRVARDNAKWRRAYAVAVLVAATGLGRHEIRRLTWESVDPFAGTVAGRPLTAEALDVLMGFEKRRMFAPGRCRVSDLILSGRCWKDAWNAMMRASGLEGVTLNDVRAIQCGP